MKIAMSYTSDIGHEEMHGLRSTNRVQDFPPSFCRFSFNRSRICEIGIVNFFSPEYLIANFFYTYLAS